MTALAAPSLLAGKNIATAADLASLPLLQIESRSDEWPVWFARHGITAPPPRGMVLDQFAAMLQAAMHGLGVALLPEFLARGALAEGHLAPAFGGPIANGGAYFLVWPEARGDHGPLRAFGDWLVAACAEDFGLGGGRFDGAPDNA